MYLGLLALLGAGFFGVAIARPPALVLRRLLPGAWIVAVVGTAAVLTDQLAEAGVDLPDAFATSFGPAIVERGVPLLIAGLAVAVAARQGGWHRPATAVVAAAAAGALIADVLSSHAAAGRNPTIDIVIQSLHVVAVGLWLGGLVGLLLTVRRQPATALTGRTAKRFSWLATVGIATVAVTGILRAIGEVGSIDGLLSSDFGHLVIAKSGLLGVLALLGAVNHFRNVPAASRVLTGLRRVGTTEILVGGTVLLLSATLVNIAPPSSVAAASASPAPSPTPAPLVVSGSDFGTSVRLALEVSPGLTGFNTFRATVTDYDTGAPVAADGVTLRFSLPARSDVGGSRLDLAPAGAGVFSATGSNLSLDGSWTVTALVARGTASVEVPLQLSIQSTRQPVEVNRVPGIPTIYTVHLSAGRSVQVYLDPDRPGQNDVHVTFFDASGSELPATGIAVSVSTAGAPSRALSVRTLEPGHVVATLTVPATTATFVIVGTAPDGERLQAQLDLTPGA
jgi:copper transport protein